MQERINDIIEKLEIVLTDKLESTSFDEKIKPDDLIKLLIAIQKYIGETKPADHTEIERNLYEKIFAKSRAKQHYYKMLEALEK